MSKAMSVRLPGMRADCIIGSDCRERTLLGRALVAAPICQMAGLSRLAPPYRIPRPAGAGFHLVLGTREGAGLMVTAHGERRLVTGDLVLVPAGMGHAYRIDGDYWDIAWLHLHPGPLARFFPQDLRIRNDPQRIASLNALLGACLDGMGRRRSAHLMRALQEWVIEELGDPAQDPVGDALLTELYATIADRLHAPWRIADLARLAGLSAAQLHRRSVAAYGVAPLRRLTELRLDLARELVVQGDLGLRAIAARTGYGDEFALSSAFKRRWGASPRSYAQKQVSEPGGS